MFTLRNVRLALNGMKKVESYDNLFMKRYNVNCDFNNAGLRFLSRFRKSPSDEVVKLAFHLYMPPGQAYTSPGQDSDEAPPIIIMHGLLGSKSNWASVAKEVHKKVDRKIYTVDARNHGDSPHTKQFNYELMVCDLVMFLKERHLEKASFIGHSMGGRTVMLLAMLYPKMVHSMIIVDVSPFDSKPHHISDIMKILRSIRDLDLDPYMPLHEARGRASMQLEAEYEDMKLVKFILSNMISNEDNSQWFWKFNLQSIMKNFETHMSSLPVLRPASYNGRAMFISGEKSDYLLREDEPEIRNLFPEASFIHIQNAGHWVHVDSFDWFCHYATQFLR